MTTYSARNPRNGGGHGTHAAHGADVPGGISAKEDRYLAHNTKNRRRESPRRDAASQRVRHASKGCNAKVTCSALPGDRAPTRLRQNRLEDWEIDPELQAFAATLLQDLFGE